MYYTRKNKKEIKLFIDNINICYNNRTDENLKRTERKTRKYLSDITK